MKQRGCRVHGLCDCCCLTVEFRLPLFLPSFFLHIGQNITQQKKKEQHKNGCRKKEKKRIFLGVSSCSICSCVPLHNLSLLSISGVEIQALLLRLLPFQKLRPVRSRRYPNFFSHEERRKCHTRSHSKPGYAVLFQSYSKTVLQLFLLTDIYRERRTKL